MTLVILALWLMAGALLQTLGPAPAWLGQAKLPWLMAVALYYALNRSTAWMMVAAVCCGLAQDLMDIVPLGYSAAVFGVLALVVSRFRNLIMGESAATAAFFGFVAGALVTLARAALLAREGVIAVPLERLALKAFGCGVLGAVCTPAVFWLAHHADELVGNVVIKEVVDDFEQPLGE